MHAASTSHAPRLAAVEFLRVAGCVTVCMFHALAPWPRTIIPGSELFMALTIAFATRAATGIGFADLLKRRFLSLIVTWLCWCAIYGAYLTFGALRHHDPPFSWFEGPAMLLAGPIWELWFPPFAFVVTIGIVAALRAVRDWSPPRAAIALSLLAGASLLVCSSLHGWWIDESSMPYHEWLRMTPAAIFGAAIARLPTGARASRRPVALIWVIMIAAALGASLAGWGEIPSRYFATVSYVCLAWCTTLVASPALLFVSRLTFGVYLVHMAVILVYYKVGSMMHLPTDPWIRGVAITLGSFALIPALRYTRLRWLVGVWESRRPARQPAGTVVRPATATLFGGDPR